MQADIAMTFMSIPAIDYTPKVDGRSLTGMDWELIAGALGAVRHPGADLLRAMYGGDERACRAILARVKGAMLADLGLDRAGEVSRKVVKEFICPPICPTCSGHGQRVVNDLMMVCVSCHGEGLRPRVAMKEDEEPAYLLLRRWHDSAAAIVWREINE
jgi:hypothetical protein